MGKVSINWDQFKKQNKIITCVNMSEICRVFLTLVLVKNNPVENCNCVQNKAFISIEKGCCPAEGRSGKLHPKPGALTGPSHAAR